MRHHPPNRRHFLQTTSAVAVGALVYPAFAEDEPKGKNPIKIGQIGTGHSHASGKMRVYRASPDFEVVGIVETDPLLRTAAENNDAFCGLH